MFFVLAAVNKLVLTNENTPVTPGEKKESKNNNKMNAFYIALTPYGAGASLRVCQLAGKRNDPASRAAKERTPQ